MKVSNLKELIEDFNSYYLWGPVAMGVHYLCDCGCGGDSYTSESWDEVCQLSDEAYKRYFNYCKENNIEWDYE